MKKTFRSRVGTVVRRSSSFLGSRPSTPARLDSDSDPMQSRGTSLDGAATKAASVKSTSSAPVQTEQPDKTIATAAEEIAKDSAAPSERGSIDQTPAVTPPPEAAPSTTGHEEVKKSSASIQTSPVEESAPAGVQEAREVQPAPLPEAQPKEVAPPSAPINDGPAKSITESEEPIPQTESPAPLSVRHSLEQITESPRAESTQTTQTDQSSFDGYPQALSPIQESPSTYNPPEAAAEPHITVTASSPARDPPKTAGLFLQPPQENAPGSYSEGTTPRPLQRQAPTVSQAPSYQSTVTISPTKGKEKEEVTGYTVFDPTDVATGGESAYKTAMPMPMPRSDDAGSIHTEASGFPFNNEDPFRDPVPAPDVPAEPLPPSRMADPGTSVPSLLDEPAPRERSFHDITPAPVVMPLPPLHEVTTQTIRNMPSDYTLAARSSKAPSIRHNVETDETRPLLARDENIRAQATGTNPTWPAHQHNFHALGWTEHVLPDATAYYTHNLMRVTTDADLRSPQKLKAVASYLDRKLPAEMTPPPDNWELWLRDASTKKGEFVPVRSWVNHGARTLSFDPPPTNYEQVLPDTVTNDDRLDLEYRYWAFMETHPAHAPLPFNAHTDALDALTWSYTGYSYPDRVLKSQHPARPPFNQEECQELMGILRSLTNAESSIQAVVHTRVVSRILLRVVKWRQQHLRPEKPLPRDVTTTDVHGNRHTPYRRTALDFVLAWLCFGIPYFFANRHGYQRFDEESGMRTVGPMLVIGASACLVAAIILSASVTFLALPGLDNVARTAGFIAILGSTASLASSLIAIFRHQTEVERMAVGGEGLMVSTGGSFLLSLPTVFLAWSVVAFVTGVMLYAFRGVSLGDPSHWTERFAEYTRWTAVGVLGFGGGVLITSLFFVRR